MNVKNLVLVGMFAVIIAVFSITSIPLPFGVPVTLQTLAIFLCGYVLGPKKAPLAVFIYIILGLIGLPVFSSGSGGIGHFFGLTGGFILGFLPMSFFCGIGSKFDSLFYKFILGFVGLIVCNIFGILQFSIVSKNTIKYSFLIASAPFLIKDVLILILSLYASKKLTSLIYKNFNS